MINNLNNLFVEGRKSCWDLCISSSDWYKYFFLWSHEFTMPVQLPPCNIITRQKWL